MTVHTRLESVLLRINLTDVENWDLPYRMQHVDSLDFIELAIECEREFDIHLLDEELAGVKTINDLLKLIESKLKL